MALKLDPDVAVTRDEAGVVRGLNHLSRPYLAAGDMTPVELAVSYLSEAAEVLGITAVIQSEAGADRRPDPADGSSRLIATEPKAILDTVTVAFSQHQNGLPIWEAGVTVTMLEKPLQVVTASSAYRAEVQVAWLADDLSLGPKDVDRSTLARILYIVDENQMGLEINAPGRWWLYRYDPAQRHHPAALTHGEGRSSGPPTLDLPAAPDEIQPGVHYPVIEALFRLNLPVWGALNWLAFIEPVTGSVVYLRAITASATGRVFLTDRCRPATCRPVPPSPALST